VAKPVVSVSALDRDTEVRNNLDVDANRRPVCINWTTSNTE